MTIDTLRRAIDELDAEIAVRTTARTALLALLPAPTEVTLEVNGHQLAALAIAELDVRPRARREAAAAFDRPVADTFDPATLPRSVPRRTRVLAATPEARPRRVKEIADVVDEAQSHVHGDLQALAKAAQVARVGHGRYQRTPAGTEELVPVWNGAMKRPLIDREDASQAQIDRGDL